MRDVQQPESRPEEPWRELGPILDRELNHLSDKYRLPIVLCDLEGRSRKDVARQLAIPEGTLSSRLNTARRKLAKRLARYGFTASAAALGILLMETATMASLSLPLLSSTTKAALLVAENPAAATGIVSATVRALTEGVLKTMFIAKIKTVTLVLCGVAALGVGSGGVYYQTRVEAADSPQASRVVQNDGKGNSESRDREIDKLKRENERLKEALENASMEKKKLRERMESLEEMAKALAADAERVQQQYQGLVATQRSQDNRKKASEQPDRKYTEQLRILDKLTLEKRLVQLEGDREELKRQFKVQLEKLNRERKQLEQTFRKQIDELELRKADFLKQHPDLAPNQRANRPASGADKLDQILERLERLEKRLDRLEKGRP